MNLGVLAAVSAPTAGLVVALIALYRAKAQQRLDHASQAQIESDMNKRVANRRIMLERYADDVQRYHGVLRLLLMKKLREGTPFTAADFDAFPRPPQLPTINGDTERKAT